MKMICLILSALAATAAAEQLPLVQPAGYQIQTPAVPFTGEEVLAQPSQQYLTPDLSAVASAPTIPGLVYEEPSAVAAPVQTYEQPDVGLAAAAPSQGYQQPIQTYAAPEYQAPAQYDFAYTVSAYDPVGNKVDFGHSEQRNDAHTTGSYYVLLPDSRVMRVEYYVDETGFHPTYTYEGEAVYPQASAALAAPVQQPSQLYSQPSQLYSQPGRK
ncbi:cuticle protein 18.6-like [Macrobrachium rosenbergii]|uniref:cuticle protein 18.6-like n=1 Tax=Macrobrachium rosenbergii TaxID=79674 RepID=UPI0034D5452E